jgi:hypothetical protein
MPKIVNLLNYNYLAKLFLKLQDTKIRSIFKLAAKYRINFNEKRNIPETTFKGFLLSLFLMVYHNHHRPTPIFKSDSSQINT